MRKPPAGPAGRAALRWVRHNVAGFGGDAHNVTLFGESGDAVGTCAQIGHWTTFARTGSPGGEWARAGSQALRLAPSDNTPIDALVVHLRPFSRWFGPIV